MSNAVLQLKKAQKRKLSTRQRALDSLNEQIKSFDELSEKHKK
jgi:hypothetical protein